MQEKNNFLNIPVRYIKGVGPKKGELLERLGLKTVSDVLYHLPMRYEDRSKTASIKDLKTGVQQTVHGEVVTTTTRLSKGGMAIFQIAITDGTGFIHAIWFNQPYLKDIFRKGRKVVLYGKVEQYDKLEIVQPEYEILEGDESDSIHIGRIVPIYSLTSQLAQRALRTLVFEVISKYAKFLPERMPTYMLAREKLVDLKFAVRNIHFPASFANLEKAYRRIVFDEFFMLQLALAVMKRSETRPVNPTSRYQIIGKLIDSFRRSMPFELTDGQKKAVDDIEKDLSSGRTMNRLLEGDVGSGKTVVAAHALILALQNGFQGVVMAPTEVLARQHFIVLSELLMPLGVNVALLISGIDIKAKARIHNEIADGKIDIVIGTHAVIQEAVRFRKLGVAVIDEQHKFGVTQRALLKDKAYEPHVLLMTATPIPRTLALTVYGDLDISVIKEMPKGRKPITTYWIEEDKRHEAYKFVREELEGGRQAYVVCPLIDKRAENGEKRVESATETFEKLKNEEFEGFSVGLLHGRMGSREKEKVMRDFKKGAIDLLVSTIVIEVGVDVPNASVMVVENADRFGLAQLHQLRGRVGRGEHDSYCLLLADPRTESAEERLMAIKDTLDGFQIAEADLEIRGPGEFFGSRQHGLPEIRFGNILKDFDIMESARKEAFAVIEKDPEFKEERHWLLKQALSASFKGRFDLIKVG